MTIGKCTWNDLQVKGCLQTSSFQDVGLRSGSCRLPPKSTPTRTLKTTGTPFLLPIAVWALPLRLRSQGQAARPLGHHVAGCTKVASSHQIYPRIAARAVKCSSSAPETEIVETFSESLVGSSPIPYTYTCKPPDLADLEVLATRVTEKTCRHLTTQCQCHWH